MPRDQLRLPPTGPLTFADLPTVCPWAPPAGRPEPPGRGVPPGTPKQEKWAKKIKTAAVPEVLAALGDLLLVRGENDLRDIGRECVLELLDCMNAEAWIDWQVEARGAVDPLVVALWRRCRPQALYRRALPEARAWREGITEAADLAALAETQAAFNQARKVGYLVVGSVIDSAEAPYTEWCQEVRLALIIVDMSVRYSWSTGPVVTAEHARVRLSLLYCRRDFSDAERAEIEACCRACAPADDSLSGVFVRAGCVLALVPRGLAAPLAARLHEIAVRPDHPEICIEP